VGHRTFATRGLERPRYGSPGGARCPAIAGHHPLPPVLSCGNGVLKKSAAGSAQAGGQGRGRRISPEGYMVLTDRAKTMIKRTVNGSSRWN